MINKSENTIQLVYQRTCTKETETQTGMRGLPINASDKLIVATCHSTVQERKFATGFHLASELNVLVLRVQILQELGWMSRILEKYESVVHIPSIKNRTELFGTLI